MNLSRFILNYYMSEYIVINFLDSPPTSNQISDWWDEWLIDINCNRIVVVYMDNNELYISCVIYDSEFIFLQSDFVKEITNTFLSCINPSGIDVITDSSEITHFKLLHC